MSGFNSLGLFCFCSREFDLPWDPVIYTHAHMTIAQNRVTSLRLEKNTERQDELEKDYLVEEFCKDDTPKQYWDGKLTCVHG